MKKNKTDIEMIRGNFPEKDLRIKKIRSEASVRDFYRFSHDNISIVAMVYPEKSKDDIERIMELSEIYLKKGLKTPKIFNVIEDRIVLFEDLGEISLQRFYSKSSVSEKKETLKKIAEILFGIGSISLKYTKKRLDIKRLGWELDYFYKYFVKNFIPSPGDSEKVKAEFEKLVSGIKRDEVFAHRDFHSRNIFVKRGELYLIDFQDSLAAPEYYDLVSFAYDSYLNVDNRDYLFKIFSGLSGGIDMEQVYLSALQRNLKALGTFGFQIFFRNNRGYGKYILRTVKNILNNPILSDFGNIEKLLSGYFGK